MTVTRGNDVKKYAEEICSKKEIKDVYFVACGGSLASLYSPHYLLRCESANVDSTLMNANEFVHATPARVNENAVVITCSLSGTPETIEATKVAKKLKATTIAISSNPNSPLFEYADYKFIEGRSGSEASDPDGKVDATTKGEALALRFCFELLRIRDKYKNYKYAIEGFTMLDGICKRAEKKVRGLALKFGEEHKYDDTIYTMGSGALISKAYSLSICIFMEMEWLHSFHIHTDEFFNGPFEMVERDRPFVIFMSAGKTRKMDERALKFLRRHCDRVTIIDVMELGVSFIHQDVEEYFSAIVCNAMYTYASALATCKCHPIPERRYMHKFEY